MLGAPYHPQSQGAIEAFNNTFKINFIKHTIIYKSNEEEMKESMKKKKEIRFSDKLFPSLLQLKKKAYNNRIYPERYSLITIMKKLLKMWS